jgi:cytochrome subunit of sulfide dehydrogenase
MRPLLAATLLGLAAALPVQAAETRGQLLAGGCAGCHGVNGQGSHGVPAIAQTQTRAEFLAMMAAFRANERANTIMGRVSRGYSEDEIALLAAHYARAN